MSMVGTDSGPIPGLTHPCQSDRNCFTRTSVQARPRLNLRSNQLKAAARLMRLFLPISFVFLIDARRTLYYASAVPEAASFACVHLQPFLIFALTDLAGLQQLEPAGLVRARHR
eukprot:6196968-Pleurochrysis_carterae.AAC.1